MQISLLHTSAVHEATFEAIFRELDPTVAITHHTREDLLDRARREGPASIRDDVLEALSASDDADAVLCTCSSLGPPTDEASKHDPRIVRIDRPLIETACQVGPEILVVICLESTREPTLDLLNQVAGEMRAEISPQIVLCEHAWLCFEAGDTEGYANQIAGGVREAVGTRTQTDCIVLAQASMRPAEALLGDMGIPVLSSPILAAKRALKVAGAKQWNSEAR